MAIWEQKTQFQRIELRWNEVDSVYDRINSARRNIISFYRPDLGPDVLESSDMLQLGGNLYEGSPPWVARSAAIAFQGNSVSKKLDWFKYKFNHQRLEGIDELDEFAQNGKNHMASVYQRGNFYDVQPQFTLDGWTTGDPLMFIEENPVTGFVMFIPFHFSTYRLFYDMYNKTEGVIIKDEWSAKKCFDKFCPAEVDGRQLTLEQRLEKAKEIFSMALHTTLTNGLLDRKFTVWRAVFKKDDPIWGDKLERPLDPDMKWYDVYFEDVGKKEREDKPLLTGGYRSKPFVNWPYNKKTWETGARTPAFYAIYDSLSMQQIFKNYLDNLQVVARPPVVALKQMEGRLKLGAEGETYVSATEWDKPPRVIENIGNITLELETLELFEKKQSRHFHLELFRLFTDLAQQAKQEFRVLQLAEMAGERISMLLPTIETHESYLASVDLRVRDIERRAGRGPFNRRDMENITDILIWALGPEARNARIAPEFIGTLRQAQQMQQKLKPISTGIAALSELGEAMQDPGYVRRMVKGYDVGDEAIRAVNFPQKLITEKEQYDLEEQAEQQAALRDKQLAQAVELMKAGKVNLQGEVAETSPAGQLTA
jgi:hypothetical protein